MTTQYGIPNHRASEVDILFFFISSVLFCTYRPSIFNNFLSKLKLKVVGIKFKFLYRHFTISQHHQCAKLQCSFPMLSEQTHSPLVTFDS